MLMSSNKTIIADSNNAERSVSTEIMLMALQEDEMGRKCKENSSDILLMMKYNFETEGEFWF
jgi:hypothetical protein